LPFSYFPRAMSLLFLMGMAAAARADDVLIAWPADWTVQPVPTAADASGVTVQGFRQRAVKSDVNGDPLMVAELTRTPLQPGHEVNLGAVLLEMRKAVQIHFGRGGYQSVCTHIHDSLLGDLPAAETTCKIILNGGHVMTQTLVAATQGSMAYSLSYAGSASGYDTTEQEVIRIRSGLKLTNP